MYGRSSTRLFAHSQNWFHQSILGYVRKLAFGLLLILPISILPAVSAAPVKPGANCAKQGSTRIAGGLKFKCIKSGKKLVWSKGETVKVAAPTPSPSPSPTPTQPSNSQVANSFSKDPRITALSDLSSNEICKTTDQTPDRGFANRILLRNGFPRPEGSNYGAKNARVLLIPLSFTDRPFLTSPISSSQTLSDLDLAKSAMVAIEKGFEELSAGRLRVKVDLLPETQWWRLNFPDSIKGGWGINNMDEITRIVNDLFPKFEFKDYDSYIFITSNVATYSAQGGFDSDVKNSKSGRANLALMSGSLNQHQTFIHELGHSLFAFEDLYLFSPIPMTERDELSTPEAWDLMAGPTLALLNWNRLLMGWLRDSEVRCVSNQTSTTHYLTSFQNNDEPKLTLINLTEGVTIAAEVRDRGMDKGLLIYMIDTYIPHGQAPIRTYNTLMTKGMKKSIYGWDISILENDKDGVLFNILKTDIDKYVVPTKKDTNLGPRPESPIPLSGGELVRTSSTTAEIRWRPSNYESYRVYVTATNDFQKVYFESGMVNTSENPLIVAIKGLVCGVELRVMSHFFTKKDGQGDSRVEERILSRSQC